VADGLWHYDPTTGQTTFEATDGTLTSEDFIGPHTNPVYVAGGNVISALTGGTLTTLGRQGETVFRSFGNGSIDVVTPILARGLNAPITSPDPETRSYVQKQLSFDVSVSVLGGEPSVLHIEGVASAPVGHQVWAYVRDDGSVELGTKQMAVSSNAELQALKGFNARYRLATPNEIAERAVGGYLARNMPDALRQLLRDQGVDQGTIDSTDNYDLVNFFDIGSISNLQAYSRTWLFAPPPA
jgi:hypothetical protein